MRYIHKLFHEMKSDDFEEEYLKRYHLESTVHINLKIKPIDQPKVYTLYYVPTNKMLVLMDQIQQASSRVKQTLTLLPPVAMRQFVNELLVEELYNTNQLEGVKSTREEIAKSTREIMLENKSNLRFESMIKSYMKIIGEEVTIPKSPKDIRKIYDEITSGEIEDDELPDGDFFRKDVTYVLKKSGTGKVVHRGITPESEIVRHVEDLLDFMNGDEIPLLIKIAIGHYYFGYIHPFYDGNGRTSRFVSSIYLSKYFGSVQALSLSISCNHFKNAYLQAFEISNSIKCKGEMNFFIETFLEMLIDSLTQMNGDLSEKNKKLELAKERLSNDPNLSDGVHFRAMYVLAQNHFFDSGSGLTVKSLAEILEKSQFKTRKIMEELIDLSLVEKKGERPVYYFIRQQCFEE